MFYTIVMTPSSPRANKRPAPAPGAPPTTNAAAAASAALPTPALPSPPRRVTRPSGAPTRRPGLTVEEVVAAAIAVLDEAGVAGLSMRKVADHLGTGAATLYAYVSGRDELLEFVFDELIGRVPLPEPDPKRWREQLIQMMVDLRTVLASHRDAALAGLGRVPTSPKTLAATETMVTVMRAGGLSDFVIALGVDQLILYVSACAFEAGLFEHGGMTEADVERYWNDVHDFYASLPADRFPALSSVAPDMTGHDGDERFAFGLEVMIGGLEAFDRRKRR